VGEQLRSVARDTDSLGRWGGEEFLAVLPLTAEPEALVLAERMRAAVESLMLPGELKVTVSLGVADLGAGEGAAPWQRLLKSADHALYRAKDAGRNRVMAAGRS
jgi:diguanylate cyclase (GGDEF)-like protein